MAEIGADCRSDSTPAFDGAADTVRLPVPGYALHHEPGPDREVGRSEFLQLVLPYTDGPLIVTEEFLVILDELFGRRVAVDGAEDENIRFTSGRSSGQAEFESHRGDPALNRICVFRLDVVDGNADLLVPAADLTSGRLHGGGFDELVDLLFSGLGFLPRNRQFVDGSRVFLCERRLRAEKHRGESHEARKATEGSGRHGSSPMLAAVDGKQETGKVLVYSESSTNVAI